MLCRLSQRNLSSYARPRFQQGVCNPLRTVTLDRHFHFSCENGSLCCALLFLLCWCPLFALTLHIQTQMYATGAHILQNNPCEYPSDSSEASASCSSGSNSDSDSDDDSTVMLCQCPPPLMVTHRQTMCGTPSHLPVPLQLCCPLLNMRCYFFWHSECKPPPCRIALKIFCCTVH